MYKSKFKTNNTDLQSILDTINAMSGGIDVDNNFVPTNSGGTTQQSALQDNNIDLQRILELALMLPADTLGDSLVDFEYIKNGVIYTLTDWKGTLNGVSSTELVIPNHARIIL